MTNENRKLEGIVRSAAGKQSGELPLDPDVKLPADVQASIAQGEAEFQHQRKRRRSKRDSPKGGGAGWIFGTAVVDKEVHDRREDALEKKMQESQGKRGQPPMLERLRVVRIIVDRILADGVPFDASPSSSMNKLVRARLNEMAAKTRDPRKSRRKQISPQAVQDLLRQIKDLDD